MHFKLHAPGQTRVEGEVKDGKLVKLHVQPESRLKDVKSLEPFGRDSVKREERNVRRFPTNMAATNWVETHK